MRAGKLAGFREEGGCALNKRTALGIGLLAVAMMSVATFGYEVFFADAAGNKIGLVWEGNYVYVAVKDPDKGACGIAEFPADLVIFDFKTGAYILVEDDPNTPAYEGAWFREARAGSGLYFWVTNAGSNQKVGVQVGDRFSYPTFPYGHTHVLGTVAPAPVVPATLAGFAAGQWEEGAWEYVDENVINPLNPATYTAFNQFPQGQLTARVDFEGLVAGVRVLPNRITGRVENMDTLIAIVADGTDPRNIDQAQVKLRDTVSELAVTPKRIDYNCDAMCANIIVTIKDKDENLNCNEIEYVPFFVIVNPGGWNPVNSGINNFCSLMLRGGFDPAAGADLNRPIRWYNIYDEPSNGVGSLAGVTSRFIRYPAQWLQPGNLVGRVLFFATETAPDSGVFEFNFGNIQDLQAALGFRTFLPGTTIAFYYIDPNDWDDMELATVVVGDRPHSETFITDAAGAPVQVVRLGHGGLYIRVYDADANVDACCQDKILVHICDPHNEDDSEYYVIDEVSNNSGIFFTQNGIPLQPVWDAVSGYQLVFDDWKVQAFNEDTIFVRYNSVDYRLEDINALGDRNANDGFFPPRIDETATRNQPWDVSFAKVKVYDTQVFDGATHKMWFLDGDYKRVTKIPVGGSLYLEVEDLDQNENPLLRELISGRWNIDATPADDLGRNHNPRYDGVFGLPDPRTLTVSAGEDSAPIWWRSQVQVAPPPDMPPGPPEEPIEPPPPPPPQGDSDVMTPRGLVSEDRGPYVDPYLGAPQWPFRANDDVSITAIWETVKVVIWNAQNGNWEKIDLRETAPNSGIFRSTTCVELSTASTRGIPGMGNLGAKPGDTIMAFYQDPSNHSDISIISIKVSEGGAGDVVPPVVTLAVDFDRATYNPGDTVVITVTDEQYASALEIAGAAPVLVLTDRDGGVLKSWTSIPALAGQPGKFQVTYVLPADVKLGTITATYSDPVVTARKKTGTATVVAKALQDVTGISVSPNPFSTVTTFRIMAVPAGAVAAKITIAIYDLTGVKVATLTGTNTDQVSWNGGSLRNGAYIYVAVVEWPGKSKTFKDFVYIQR